MKKIRKCLAFVVAVATLGTVSAIPTSAIIDKEDIDDPSIVEWYEENAITEAIIYLGDAGEDTGTYYWTSVEPSIDLSSLSEEDMATFNSGFPVKIDAYSIDTSAVEKVITIDDKSDEDGYIAIDCISCYTHMYYEYNEGEWLIETSSIRKNTIGDSTATDEILPDIVIGDSDSDEPSETTLQRGDVNGDGTINALDLLQLKKYILGIIDSLE